MIISNIDISKFFKSLCVPNIMSFVFLILSVRLLALNHSAILSKFAWRVDWRVEESLAEQSNVVSSILIFLKSERVNDIDSVNSINKLRTEPF